MGILHHFVDLGVNITMVKIFSLILLIDFNQLTFENEVYEVYFSCLPLGK